jgi:hypothetical protein
MSLAQKYSLGTLGEGKPMNNLTEKLTSTNLLITVTGCAWMGVFVAGAFKVYGII